MSSTQTILLSSIYCHNLICNHSQHILPFPKNFFHIQPDIIQNSLIDLEQKGFIHLKGVENAEAGSKNLYYELTKLGRSMIKVILVGGVFDLLHIGHIHTLQTAKSLGDVLVVVVATNSTVSRTRKNRKIYHDEKDRLELVSSIKYVDHAMIGKNDSLYETVEFVKPDIIALGYDQNHNEKTIKNNCLARGMNIEIVRLSSQLPDLKSSLIKKELGTSFYET